jgi:hypothetical protein
MFSNIFVWQCISNNLRRKGKTMDLGRIFP